MKQIIAASFVAACFAATVAMGEPSNETFQKASAAHKAGRYAEAATLFRELAESVHGDAQYNLAVLFYKGEGVLQSDKSAFYWAWMARIYGIPDASVIIDLLDRTLTNEARFETADKLLEDLTVRIDRGDLRAMLGIARVYEELLETPDPVAAYTWRIIAAAMQVEGAALLRDATAISLSADLRMEGQAKADQLFNEWCKKAGADAPACHGRMTKEEEVSDDGSG